MTKKLITHYSSFIICFALLLHETTQRRVCRGLFLIACVLPTVATVAWIGYFYRPSRQADWQQTLTENLHVGAEAGEISSPRPGVTHVSQIRLTDLRSRRDLGLLTDLKIQWHGSRLVVEADHLETSIKQLPAIAATIATWLARDEQPTVELRIDRLSIVGRSSEALQLRHFVVHGEAGRLTAEVLPNVSDPLDRNSAIHLVVEGKRGNSGVAVRTTLSSERSSLPTWLITDIVPGLGRYADAMFTGAVEIDVEIDSDADHRSGHFVGRLTGIDLQASLAAGSPHRVTGIASADIHQLRWQDGRIEVAEGELLAGRGTISSSLLSEMIRRLYCVPGQPTMNLTSSPTSGDPLQAFDELGCRFRLTDAGITLQGCCVAGGSGALLAADGGPLLMEPPHQNIWLAHLVQVFSQPAKTWLPATREAHQMSGVLPLPK